MAVDRRDSSAALTGGASYPSLRGRSVFITGGGSGIGACLTESFARQGALVAFVDVAEAASQALVEKIEAAGHAAPLVSQDRRHRYPGAAERPSATRRRRVGDFHVLINNVANDDRHSLMDVTPEYYDARIAVNQRPAFFAIQAVVPGMKKMGGGSIINFGSNSYGAKGRNFPVYTTAKSSVIGLTRGLAAELGEHRIRINVITPGWIMTAAADRQVAHARRRARDPAQPGAARQGAARRRRAAWRCSSPPTTRAPAPRRNTSSTRAGSSYLGINLAMRLLQYVDNGRTRVARVDDDGAGDAAGALRDACTSWRARPSPNARRSSRLLAGSRSRRRSSYAELLRDGRLLPPLTHPDPAHCLVSGTGLTHLGSAAARDSMHAETEQAGHRADRLDEDVQVGRRRRQARGQQARHAAGVVLQGQRRQRRGLRQRARLARLRRGSWRGAGAGRLLPHRRPRPAAPPRFRHRQRVLRPRHRAAQLSTAGALEAAPVRRRARCSTPARCPRTWKARAASAATARCCGRNPSSPAKATCATPSPTSNTTTSSTGSTACPATCTCISSAPRR